VNFTVLKVVAHNEVRLRMRRWSSVIAVLAVVLAIWNVIVDPSTGFAMMVVKGARVEYTSLALALGSAVWSAMLFGLGGFYLARGRMAEDLRSGTGGVIGATPASNAVLLLGRWLGAVAYLGALVTALAGAILVLHLVRGSGPIEPLVYAETYLLTQVPMILFVASCAILFDAVPLLLGKVGDILYFILWMMQLALLTESAEGVTTADNPLLLFDFNGMVTAVSALSAMLNTTSLSVGASDFNPSLPALVLQGDAWRAADWGRRGITCVLALLPLLPAALLFHRFSPDRVKAGKAAQRRTPLQVADQLLRPLSRAVRPLFGVAARLPGMPGQVLGDIALTLAMSPTTVLTLLLALAGTILAPAAQLGGVMIFCVAAWALAISDLHTRDYQADMEGLTGAVPGGAGRRYLRQWAAVIVLGLAYMGMAALRWSMDEPVRALAVLTGVLALGSFASLAGLASRTSRTFIALFMFALYVATNARDLPRLDAVGFNGVANAGSVLTYAIAGLAALAAGHAINSRRAR
jgi:hypothetical protein